MKHSFFSFLTLAIIQFSYGQLQVPQPSPSSTYIQTVGLTEVTVQFFRPSVRERKIFGDLVPYDKLWRTGANQNTTIAFSDDVIFGGIEVPKGTYALYTKPSKTQWQVYLYNKTDNWGLPSSWDEELIIAQVEAQPVILDISHETLSIGVNKIHNNGGSLLIVWDNIYLSIPFLVPTAEKAIASIEKTLGETPSENDYYQAASYYQQEGLDLEKALSWIDKAIEKNAERYWYHRPRALILADLEKYEEAIEAAESSLRIAEAAGNTDYVRLNQKSINAWRAKIEGQ